MRLALLGEGHEEAAESSRFLQAPEAATSPPDRTAQP